MENRSGGARKRASAPGWHLQHVEQKLRDLQKRPGRDGIEHRRLDHFGRLSSARKRFMRPRLTRTHAGCAMTDLCQAGCRRGRLVPQSKATPRKPPLCLAAHQDCFPVLRSDSPCSWRRRPHSFTRPIMRHPRSIRVCIRSCAMPACPSRRFSRWRVALARCPCCPAGSRLSGRRRGRIARRPRHPARVSFPRSSTPLAAR